MSLSYNGTFGTKFLSDAAQQMGPLQCGAAWFNASSEGAGQTYLFSFGPNANEKFRVVWNGGGVRKLRLDFCWGNYASWEMTTGFPALNVWTWIGFTYDFNSINNKPTLYTLVGNTFSILTEGSGLTAIQANPVGGAVSEPQLFSVGANVAAGGNWTGLIGEVAFWKRLLSAADMNGVARNGVNVCPDHFNYLPQDGGRVQNLGSSGVAFTPTNITTGENPPIRPVGRRG